MFRNKQNKLISSAFAHHTPAMRVLLQLAEKIQVGTLTIIFSQSAEEHVFAGQIAGPSGTLIIHDDAVAKRLLFGGMLGFNEAYDDGLCDSPNLDDFFQVVLANEHALNDPLLGSKIYRLGTWLVHKLRPNSKRGARKNIAQHYDLGNKFYQSWLDESMTYSSAVFATPQQNLFDAQQNKYQKLVDLLQIKSDSKVLEIGCGWGGFAEYVAKNIGAHVHAVTISQEQFDYAVARINKAGLAGKVRIELRDYRDLTEQYDAIASIEMFEAVGEKYWPTYFNTLYKCLKPQAIAALQIITIEDHRFPLYRKTPDYIQKYIFPGGMLPCDAMLKHHVRQAQLNWLECHSYGQHYARTLRLWKDAFYNAWPTIETMGFDTRFKRMWTQYLDYCTAGFTCGNIDVVQLAVQRI